MRLHLASEFPFVSVTMDHCPDTVQEVEKWRPGQLKALAGLLRGGSAGSLVLKICVDDDQAVAAKIKTVEGLGFG